MNSIVTEVISVRDELYVVKRKVKIENEPIVDDWKEYLNCDTVFKHQPTGYYYFCNHIPCISYEESQN